MTTSTVAIANIRDCEWQLHITTVAIHFENKSRRAGKVGGFMGREPKKRLFTTFQSFRPSSLLAGRRPKKKQNKKKAEHFS